MEGLGSFQGGLLEVAGKSFRSKVALSCGGLENKKNCHRLLFTRKRVIHMEGLLQVAGKSFRSKVALFCGGLEIK